MEEDILFDAPDFRLYRDRAIFWGTFLGGPLAAGYMAAENFKHLGEQSKVRIAWLIAIITSVSIVIALVFIPAVEKIPNYLMPLFFGAFAQLLVQKTQGTAIRSHIDQGGQLYSNWRAAAVGLIGAATWMLMVFGCLYLSEQVAFT